jgi:AraC-like DNA-binding protein
VAARFKGKFAIGATALAAAALAGGAYAATQSGTSSRQQFVNDVAQRLHVSPEQLQAALKAAMVDRLNQAVKDGRLTQAQANAIEQRIETGKLPLGFGMRRTGHRLRQLELRAAEQYLGLTQAQLIAQLRGGKSLAQVATDQGKTTAGLEAAMTAALKARLDKAVSAGRITQAQEQELLSRFQTRLDRRVNHAGLGHPHTMPYGAPHPG